MSERRIFKVALTGSIAMGKSTVAGMIRESGVPVFDADAAVHQLYARNGKAVPLIAEAFPEAIINGMVDRKRLSSLVLNNPEAIARLEGIVHPLVHEEQTGFLEQCMNQGHDIVVFDIPLLFEGGRAREFDAVLVVSATADQQQQRALAREGMTVEKFRAIVARQVPDAVKRQQADFVISTSISLEDTRRAVDNVVHQLRQLAREKAEDDS